MGLGLLAPFEVGSPGAHSIVRASSPQCASLFEGPLFYSRLFVIPSPLTSAPLILCRPQRPSLFSCKLGDLYRRGFADGASSRSHRFLLFLRCPIALPHVALSRGLDFGPIWVTTIPPRRRPEIFSPLRQFYFSLPGSRRFPFLAGFNAFFLSALTRAVSAPRSQYFSPSLLRAKIFRNRILSSLCSARSLIDAIRRCRIFLVVGVDESGPLFCRR